MYGFESVEIYAEEEFPRGVRFPNYVKIADRFGCLENLTGPEPKLDSEIAEEREAKWEIMCSL